MIDNSSNRAVSSTDVTSEPDNRRILVVDDNRAIHDDFRKILTDDRVVNTDLESSENIIFGNAPASRYDVYDFDSAYQGLEALDLVRQATNEGRPYAVAFVDLRMPPGIDGVQTARQIWQIDPNIQIVICTAYADYTWDEITAVLRNPDQLLIIKKPFEFIEVRQLVTALTTKWQLARHVERQMELLRSETKRTRMIIDSANEAFIATGEQGTILQWNAQAETLFGWSAKEVVGQTLATTICAEANNNEAANQWLSTTCEGQRLELLAKTKCGESVPIEVSIARVADSGSVMFNAFAHRISMRPVSDSQFANSLQAESIGQLSTGIARAINAPVQYLGDNGRFLMDAFTDLSRLMESCLALADNPENPESIDEVKTALRRADLDFLHQETPNAIRQSLDGIGCVAKMVYAMKEFCQPLRQEREPADLHKIIDSVLTVSRNEWSKIAQIRTVYDKTMPQVPCLPVLLKQTLLNLLINAAKAIEDAIDQDQGERGIITVSTRRQTGWAELRVSDTGVGIPEQDQSRIFDPFFTTDRSREAKGQGLSVAYGTIVDKHGGTIEVESSPGEGTTFIVRLPLAHAHTFNETNA